MRYGDNNINPSSFNYYTVTDEWVVYIPSVVYLHGIVACVTVAFHVMLYVPAHWAYGRVIWTQGYFAARWVEYAITCTLMSIASLSSSGPTALTTIASSVCGGVALQAIGCAIEQRKETVHFFLIVGGLVNFGTSISTVWYVLSSTGVYAPQVLEFLGYAFFYALFPLNCVLDATRRRGRFVRTDWMYIVLSLSSKLALFWLQVGEVERKVRPGMWAELQIYGLGIVLPLLLLAAGVWWAPSTLPALSAASPSPALPSPTSTHTTLLRRVCTFRLFPTHHPIVVDSPRELPRHSAFIAKRSTFGQP